MFEKESVNNFVDENWKNNPFIDSPKIEKSSNDPFDGNWKSIDSGIEDDYAIVSVFGRFEISFLDSTTEMSKPSKEWRIQGKSENQKVK